MEGAASDSGGSSSSSSEATSAYTSHRSEPYGSGSDRAKQQQPKILPTSSSKGSQNAQQHSPAKKEEDVRRGIEQMREALEMIPAEQKKAYTEAMRRAPRLVEIESAFERYLKFEEFNPWEAARKVVDYWEVRLELFGEDRAYLPLTLTGDGALSEGDMEVFRTGVFMILPKTVHGKPVLFHDRSRLDKAELLDPGKRLRCTFYFLAVLAEMSPSCACLTVYCSKTRKSTFDLKLITDGISYFIMRRVIPVRFDHLHYVMLSTRPVLDFVIPTTLKALEKVGGQKPNTVIVHSDHSVDAVQEALRSHGFSLEGLPKVPLGGLFTFGCFRRWVEDRIRVGARLYGHPSSSNLTHMGDGSDAKPAAIGAAAGSLAAMAAAVLDDDPEEAAARKRREVYAGYARRKRARKRIEAKVLQSEVARLEKQRDELERAGHDLESRLDRAQRVVAAHHHKADQQEHKNGIDRAAAGMRLSSAASAARDDLLLGMHSLPPQLARSSSNGNGGVGGGSLGMQHHLPAISSAAGLPGWYANSSPYQQCYPSAYPQGPQLYAPHGMAGPGSTFHGSRPIIFLDAATAAASACNPIYIVGDPTSYMAGNTNGGAGGGGGGGGGGGLMGNLAWSHVPLPARAPISSSSSSSFGGGGGGAGAAGGGTYPPPPPPPPSPSQPPVGDVPHLQMR